MTLLYFVFSSVAVTLNTGPLHFLFFDQSRPTTIQSHCNTLWRKIKHLRGALLFQLLRAVLVTAPAAPHKSPTTSALALGKASSPVISFECNGTSKVCLPFGRVIRVNTREWNCDFNRRWFAAVLAAGSATSCEAQSDLFVAESRFLFVMQHDGLLVNLLLMVGDVHFLPRVQDDA